MFAMGLLTSTGNSPLETTRYEKDLTTATQAGEWLVPISSNYSKKKILRVPTSRNYEINILNSAGLAHSNLSQ